MIVAATGHRPERLGGYGNQVRLALGGLATEYLTALQPDEVISGMALGWDQAFAAAAVALGIPLVAAVPFDGFDVAWPTESRDRLRNLCRDAKQVTFVRPQWTRDAFQARNEWMVDRANRMAALWDGSRSGGTYNCLAYAAAKGVAVDHLWARWTLPADVRALLA